MPVGCSPKGCARPFIAFLSTDLSDHNWPIVSHFGPAIEWSGISQAIRYSNRNITLAMTSNRKRKYRQAFTSESDRTGTITYFPSKVRYFPTGSDGTWAQYFKPNGIMIREKISRASYRPRWSIHCCGLYQVTRRPTDIRDVRAADTFLWQRGPAPMQGKAIIKRELARNKIASGPYADIIASYIYTGNYCCKWIACNCSYCNSI